MDSNVKDIDLDIINAVKNLEERECIFYMRGNGDKYSQVMGGTKTEIAILLMHYFDNLDTIRDKRIIELTLYIIKKKHEILY